MTTAENKAVFLSYASQDAAAVERLADALRAAGVEVWFDRNELVGGDAWDAKIRKQIAECALFVPVISANTQARLEGYFRIEWRLAAQRTHAMAEEKAFLLPVVIDETRDAEARVPSEFKAVQWTRLRQAYGGLAPADETAIAAFGERVQRLLRGSAVLQPAPETTARGLDPRVTPKAGRRVPAATWIAAAIVVLVLTGAVASWLRRAPVAGPRGADVTVGAKAELGEVLTKVRRTRLKIDVTRAELETSSSLLEFADRQHPNNPEIWAEWSLVDARFVNEMLDYSDARRDSMRQRALRAYGLAPEAPLARLAQAQALVTLNSGDAKVLAQAKALLEPLADKPDVDPGVLLLLSLVSRERKNPEASFRYLDRLAQLPDGAALAHLNRGIALVYAERWADAEVEIDRAMALGSAAQQWMWKSYIQAMWHGEMAGARQSVAAIPAVFLQEDFPAAAVFWIKLWSRDWDGALAVMRAIPRDYIDSGALSGPTGYFKGWVLARAGKAAAAEMELRAALEVVEARLKAKPNVRSLLVAKALVLVALGEREQAGRVRRSVVELYGEEPEAWTENFLTSELLPPELAIQALAKQADTSAFLTAARMRLDPYLDRLRGHPDFVALQARIDADPRLSPGARNRLTASPAAAMKAPEKSIAVLPFKNLSGDPAREFFSDGLSEAVAEVLGRVPSLKVVASTSASSFKGRAVPIPEIARQLGVTHLVEGTVLEDGATVRVTAKLIQADGFQVGVPEKLDRPLQNILALHDEVAGLIAKSLSLKIGARSAASTAAVNPQAFELYVQARQEWNRRTRTGYERAEQLLQRVLHLEPNFARAHAALADVWLQQGQDNGEVGRFMDRDSARQRQIIACIQQALSIDPDSAEAHASLGNVRWNSWAHTDAERSLRQAIKLNPSYASAHQWLGRVLIDQGRLEEALAALQVAMELDPLSSRIADNRALASLLAGRFREALTLYDRALGLRPDSIQALTQKAVTLAAMGREQDAADLLRTISEEMWSMRTRDNRVEVLARAKMRAEAERRFSVLDPAQEDRARLLLLLGKIKEGKEALNPDLVPAYLIHQWLWLPAIDPIRGDPRFKEFLATLGLTEAHARAQAWRAANPPEKPEAKP
jgi:TolB-like protein/Tfp pilus assembly protein PilF